MKKITSEISILNSRYLVVKTDLTMWLIDAENIRTISNSTSAKKEDNNVIATHSGTGSYSIKASYMTSRELIMLQQWYLNYYKGKSEDVF